MTLLRSFPIMVIALVLLGIIGFCAAERSVELLVVAVTLTALSWYVTEGPRGRTLPRWVSNLLVVAAALSVGVDLMMPPNEVAGVLGRFSVWLTLIKLYERRTARDHAHLMGLALLLLLVGCMKSQDLLFGIVLLLFALVGLYVLLLYQLYAAHERATSSQRAALILPRTVGTGGALRPIAGRHMALQFRMLAAVVACVGLVLSAVLFVIFPRGLLDVRSSGRWNVSGYADVIDLHAGARITTSREMVFDVRLLGEDGEPVRGPFPLLLRGTVLDRYHDGQWTATTNPHRLIETSPARPTPLGPIPASGATVRQEFRFRQGTMTLFSLYTPVAIETDRRHRLGFAPDARTIRSAGADPLTSYTVEAVIDVQKPSGGGAPARDRTARPGRAPGDRRPGGRLERLAVDLLERAGVPAEAPAEPARWAWSLEAARVFRDHLRSAAFEYTLDLSDVVIGDEDPVEHFLFTSRRGHCEYFASALAVLGRAVGIEARVITGYIGTEFDDEAGRYIVRECHAHAWVEIPIGPDTHAPLDATPPAVLAPPDVAGGDLADRFQWLYQRLESTWTSGIIQFDDRAQSRLIEAIDSKWTERVGGLIGATREWMRRVNRAFRLGPAGYIWLGSMGVVLVIAILAIVSSVRRLRRIRRSLRLRRRADAPARLVHRLGFYVDMVDALHRAGCPKPRWQPPLAFARVLARERPDSAALVREITELYYGARYARRRITGASRSRARVLLERLDHALGEGR